MTESSDLFFEKRRMLSAILQDLPCKWGLDGLERERINRQVYSGIL